MFPAWFDTDKMVVSDDSEYNITIGDTNYGTDRSLTTQIKNALNPYPVNSSAIKSDLSNLGTTKLEPKQHSFLLEIISFTTDDDESENSD